MRGYIHRDPVSAKVVERCRTLATTGLPILLEGERACPPEDCGGPLVDLDGKVIGLNIARVSRVASYAIPADRVKPVVADMLAGKYPPPKDGTALERVSTNDSD